MREPKSYRAWSLSEADDHVATDCLGFAGAALIGQPMEGAISDVLAYLGERLHVDRAWMFEYDADLTRFRNTHEWCARGVASHVEDLQDAPVSMIAWLHRSLLARKAVMIDDVAALPSSAQALRREMLRQNDRSVLSVPVFHEGRLRACIGFDAVRAPREWTTEDAAILAACARMIGQARYATSEEGGRRPPADRAAPLIYVGRGGSMRGVTLPQIAGVRSERNDTRVWLHDGSSVVDQRTFAAWRMLLPPARFPTIHRTALVNLIHIAGLEKHAGAGFHWQVQVRNLTGSWPVSRPHRKELIGRLGF